MFTPGGDLAYCIDPNKRDRWHTHLCLALQQALNLSEIPHFLVPCYTATLDRWLDPNTQTIKQFAEAYPPVLRYQALLNAVFEIGNLLWQTAPHSGELCNPLVISTYHEQFPQLWQNHDLVIRVQNEAYPTAETETFSPLRVPDVWPQTSASMSSHKAPPGYVLRLFVSGHNLATERILKTLHQLLEQLTDYPYTLKVVDVLRHPEQAEADHISATPTLIKVWPKPACRVVGEVSNLDTLLAFLGDANDIEDS